MPPNPFLEAQVASKTIPGGAEPSPQKKNRAGVRLSFQTSNNKSSILCRTSEVLGSRHNIFHVVSEALSSPSQYFPIGIAQSKTTASWRMRFPDVVLVRPCFVGLILSVTDNTYSLQIFRPEDLMILIMSKNFSVLVFSNRKLSQSESGKPWTRSLDRANTWQSWSPTQLILSCGVSALWDTKS